MTVTALRVSSDEVKSLERRAVRGIKRLLALAGENGADLLTVQRALEAICTAIEREAAAFGRSSKLGQVERVNEYFRRVRAGEPDLDPDPDL